MQPLASLASPAGFPWPTLGQLLQLKRTKSFNIGRRVRLFGALMQARLHGQPLDDLSHTCPNAVVLFQQCPNLFRAVIDNYVDSRIGALERVHIIAHELQHVLRCLRAAGVNALSAHDAVRLWQEPHTGWHVDLSLNTASPHEGLWILTLKQPGGEAVYALSLAYLPDAVLIGAVQGPKGPQAMAWVREATKALHGIRPHFFLIEIVRALCRKSGMRTLVGTDPKYRLKPSGWHRLATEVKFDYAAFWAELGGHPGCDHRWQLPLTGPRKPLDEVESKKRAMYRRRYALLDSMEQDIRLVLSIPDSAA